MASIVISFSDTGGSATTTFTMSQADMDRIMTFYRSYYPNPNGTPSTKASAQKSMSRAVLAQWEDATKTGEKVNTVIPDIPVTET